MVKGQSQCSTAFSGQVTNLPFCLFFIVIFKLSVTLIIQVFIIMAKPKYNKHGFTVVMSSTVG